MRKIFRYLSVLVFLLPVMAFSVNQDVLFQEGRDYLRLSPNNFPNGLKPPPGKIEVIEFFSYGCPWCYKLEPALGKWLPKKEKIIRFVRVPVVFESNWEIFARAYYLMKGLKREDLTLSLFAAVQNQEKPITTPEELKSFFVEKGIKATDFDGVYHSPVLDAELNKAESYLKAYEIDAVPAITVSGRYKTTFSMAKGDEKRFFEIVDYLIRKSDAENKVKKG